MVPKPRPGRELTFVPLRLERVVEVRYDSTKPGPHAAQAIFADGANRPLVRQPQQRPGERAPRIPQCTAKVRGKNMVMEVDPRQ